MEDNMKLRLEIPEGYEVKGFDYPCVGDYVLLPSGEPFEVSKDDYVYHCGGIILEKVWEPEAGCVYEFSDVDDFTCVTEIGVYTHSGLDMHGRILYFTSKSVGWKYIRPFQGKIGK